jgi:hypothetical protein
MKKVKKREIPRITWLGGTCWRDKARLIKSRTMEILRKLVIRIIILGARERTVINRRSWREKATSCPDSGFLMVRSTKGITGSAGGEGMFMVPWVDIPGKGGGVWAVPERRGTAIRSRRNAPRTIVRFRRIPITP